MARARESAGFRAWFSIARDSGKGFGRQLPGYGRQFMGQVTTYFFYDLPENRTAKDLWYSFWSYRKVVDVYIPARRDKRGRRFAFVRMCEISNVFDMERKLNHICIDSYRLKVKLADNVKRGKEVQLGGKNKQQEKQWFRVDRKVSPGVIYAQKGSMAIEIVRDKEDVLLLDADVVPVNIADRVVEPSTEKDTEVVRLHSSPHLVLQFSPTEEEVAWLKKSMVAVVRLLDMVMTIQNRFDVNGLMVNVVLLGGKQVLLVDKTEGCLEEFFKCNSDLVESWFEWIHTTSLSTMPSRSRMVWLRFAGVPLKACNERCFTGLGALLGEVILVDEDTKSKSFLSEGRMEDGSGLVVGQGTMKSGKLGIRNRLIRRELELEEVRRLFELGKRLSIECQNNQDEVMSRLVSLEERDTAGFEKA
ncbi:hypothetical protein SLEP1_g38608 [Rubroshorea leprosula]|uniref:RRM domain-containing protein n=1 Tax=Rubroshorea leprosula TaxID=152421 RepID=A0AAV5KXW2_9ROSI|nr:hypothetical protein SLEP1_g38608 [Rubroshorea leprosula]